MYVNLARGNTTVQMQASFLVVFLSDDMGHGGCWAQRSEVTCFCCYRGDGTGCRQARPGREAPALGCGDGALWSSDPHSTAENRHRGLLYLLLCWLDNVSAVAFDLSFCLG